MSSDPSDLRRALESAEDAFDHAFGEPDHEPGIASRRTAEPGEIRLQKGCRLLMAADALREHGEYYTSVLEHSFATIERSMEAYLIAVAGMDPDEFYDHETAYEAARTRSPLEESTIETVRGLYRRHRTEHYYQSSVTTRQQSDHTFEVARCIHEYLVGIDPTLGQYCSCE